jgi:hypothetical protein
VPGDAVVERFLSHAASLRLRIGFDREERNPRVRPVARLRRLMRRARSGGAWQEDLEDLFNDRYDSLGGLPLALLVPRHIEWVNRWAASDPGSMQSALAELPAPGADADQRFRRFADVAQANTDEDRGAVLVVGSLLNFALQPQELPVVRPQAFRYLEQVLGDPLPAMDISGEYAHHVAFAKRLGDRMREAGIDVRDMIDVQCLIEAGALDRELWTPSTDARGGPARERSCEVYLGVCAIFRNEARYLREWVAFHRLVGVERFFLYDNASTDEPLDALAPYTEDGTVVVHPWDPGDSRPQLPAYNDCLVRHGKEARWIAFIDLDEFLFSPAGTPLPTLLPEYERWPAVLVNSVLFGTSGHRDPPPGLVLENYTRCGYTSARFWVKSIVDPMRAERARGPHRFIHPSGPAVNENHRPVSGPYTGFPSYQRLRINHYYTRSLQEARVKWTQVGADNTMLRNVPVDRLRKTLNLREDRTIQRYLPGLRAELARTSQGRAKSASA